MASNPSYFPNESQSAITQEQTWLVGCFMSNFLFGVQTTLTVFAFLAIFRQRASHYKRMRIILLVYVIMMFVTTGTAQGLSIDFLQLGFVTQRNYPGGPSAFLNIEYGIPVNIASVTLDTISNWMMESLLVWRCYVVCSSGSRLWWFGVAVPLILLLSVLVSGSLFIHSILHSSPPTANVLAYGACSLALNLAATGFIAGRLLVHRHRVVSQLGRGYGKQYVSIAAVVVESAAIYTVFLVIVIITYATGSPATNLFQQIITAVQSIASILIILRIARGEGWSKAKDTKVMTATLSSWNARIVEPESQDAVRLEEY